MELNPGSAILRHMAFLPHSLPPRERVGERETQSARGMAVMEGSLEEVAFGI